MLPASKTVQPSIIPSVFLDEWPFDSFVKQINGGSNGTLRRDSYAFDLVEHPDAYVITMDIPGVHKDDISLSMEGNVLTLQIERKEAVGSEKAKYLHRSRWYGTTTRTLTLPEAASGDNVDASLKDGVLTIRIEKQLEKQARRIEIKALS